MRARPSIIQRVAVSTIVLLQLFFLFQLFAETAQAQGPPVRDRVPTLPAGTAVIKGRVVDAQTGSALARASVRLQAPGNPAPVMTDEAGAFKITGVPAGSWYVSVNRSGYMSSMYPEARATIRTSMRGLAIQDGQVLEGITIRLSRGGAIAGRVVDAHGEPAEGVQVQVFRAAASGRGRPQQRGGAGTNDLGEFRIARLEPGSYVLRVQGRNTMGGDDPSDVQPAPTYFPGVAAIDQAQPIAVERGQTVSGVELMLMEATATVVSGVVLDAKGRPASPGTYLSARATTEFNEMVVGGGPIRPDGTFRIKLLPGEYLLEVQSARMGVIGSLGPDDQQFGRARITVGGAPVSDVSIVLGPGAAMSGKIVFEGDATQPANLQQMNVGFGPPPNGIGCQSRPGPINADGTFRVQSVVGTCIVRVMGNLGRWNIKSITQGDADLRDRIVTFEPGQQLRDVQVVLTDKRTELELKVNDEHGQPTREYVAIAFSTDKTRWTEFSAYVRTMVPRPASQGQPSPPLRGSVDVRPPPTDQRDLIAAAPPGEYYVIAVTDITAEDTRDPAVLERLSAGATRVTLSYERSPVAVTLRRVDLR